MNPKGCRDFGLPKSLIRIETRTKKAYIYLKKKMGSKHLVLQRQKRLMKRHQYKTVQISEKVKLKSGLEEAIHSFLLSKDVLFSYETLRISFDQPTQKKSYTPDFPIEKSFIVELL